MRITVGQLRRVIREEVARVREATAIEGDEEDGQELDELTDKELNKRVRDMSNGLQGITKKPRRRPGGPPPARDPVQDERRAAQKKQDDYDARMRRR